MRHWDWDGMVEANRGWLERLLMGLFAMLGSDDRVSRRVWREVLARLLPMESALRRLIVVLARDLEVTPPVARSGSGKGRTEKRGPGKPVFPLADVLRDPDPKPRQTGKGPRVLFLDEWVQRPEAPKASGDDPVDISVLRRRLEAMRAALTDLSAQAHRLARWQGRNARMRQDGRWRRLYSIRSGRPPGHRERGKRDVDEALAACHDLALYCRAMVEAERGAAG